ncbi:polysaccharide biosynthesis protein [Pedobacter cryoconitis]|nr:hypothetical protein [Pedobacter cryoconitis]
MDLLSKEQLGYIALFQSIIMLISFLQLGVIYGGYRLISFSIERQRRANDAVISYLLLLFIGVCSVLLLISCFTSINWFWIGGVIIGLVTLWNNWISNMHIALGRTNKLSILLLSSLLLSFIAIPVLNKYPLYGAITLIGLQPVFFVVLSYIFNKDFAASFRWKNLTYLRLTIKLGFIPFLTGILHYINLQVERWVISYDLGVKALGEYYLVFVYVGLFAIVPGALGTLNFPKFMKALSNTKNDNFSLIETFKVYYIEVICYLILMSLGTIYIMPWIINLLLPSHNNGVHYVHIVFIGLILFTLIDPISFLINAKLHYKALICIYIGSVLISLSAYAFLYINKMGSLVNYSYVNVLFYSSITIGYLFYFFTIGRKSLYKS